MRFCAICTKPLLSNRSDAICCSKKCADRKYRQTNKAINMLLCFLCKQQFETYKRNDTKYCSQECRNSKRMLAQKNKRGQYYIKNKEKIKQNSKINYNKNKHLVSFQEKVKEYSRKYNKLKFKTNIHYKLKKQLRIRLHSALKKNIKSGSSVRDLGCSIEELKKYLESKFEIEMTWDNYGMRGWHIDHIRPLSSFNLLNRDELLKACHYTNLQPLWAIDNIKKSNKWIKDPN